ncbi:hypothetical protein FAM09_09515 [Niastella caeni]|uniref:Nucleotidyltransferase family protein n=1 Tax=Niastella caeni TaxID=2569763 RepID=A0A4S8HWP4_9BACT|nr:hypothetical protein [Niastella caeni]THU40113.1 hypothetical protein FAM09_09515 [Niastella caeni]
MPVQPEQSIIKALAYFDIFNYPLTQEEIISFLDQQMGLDDVAPALQRLVAEKRIFRLGNFYSLQQDHALRTRRTTGNHNAELLLTVGYKVGGFLYQFPFVRGIGISGSLSKNFADQDTDIDFFIITSANRLWIARTLMHLFKKLTFITGHQHWFCMNYFIDEAALRIEEQNIFTAIEITTLIPVCGNGTMDAFFKTNNWTACYLPNNNFPKSSLIMIRHPWYKKAAEWMLNNRLGNILDNYLMKLTTRRWLQKEQQGRLNMKGERMSLRSGKHFSKPDPSYLQKRILDMYKQKVDLVIDPASSVLTSFSG